MGFASGLGKAVVDAKASQNQLQQALGKPIDIKVDAAKAKQTLAQTTAVAKAEGAKSGKNFGLAFQVGLGAFAANMATDFVRKLSTGIRNSMGEVEKVSQTMQRAYAISPGITAPQKTAMRSHAYDVQAETDVDYNNLAGSYAQLFSAGYNVEKSMKALATVTKFAQAAQIDAARSTDMLTDAQSALGMVSQDAVQNEQNMTRIADVLVKGNQIATASVAQYADALAGGGATAAKVYGRSVEEAVAALAVFANAGVKGQEAGTALMIVERELAKTYMANSEAWKRAGVSLYDQRGKLLSLSNVVGQLEGKLKGLSDQQRSAFLMQKLSFDAKSMKYLMTLLGSSEQLREFTKSLEGAGGIMDDVAKNTLTNFETGINRAKAATTKFLEPFMMPAFDTFGRGLQATAHFLDNYGKRIMGATAAFLGFNVGVKATAFLMSGKFVTAIAGAAKAVMTFVRAGTLAQALTGPAGWASLAAGIAVAAGAWVAVEGMFNSTALAADSVAVSVANIGAASGSAIGIATGNTDEFTASLNRAKVAAENLKNAQNQKKENDLSPDIFSENAIEKIKSLQSQKEWIASGGDVKAWNASAQEQNKKIAEHNLSIGSGALGLRNIHAKPIEYIQLAREQARYGGKSYDVTSVESIDALIEKIKADDLVRSAKEKKYAGMSDEQIAVKKAAEEREAFLNDKAEALAKPLKDLETEIATIQEMWDKGKGDPVLLQREHERLTKQQNAMLGIKPKEPGKEMVSAAAKNEAESLKKGADALRMALVSPLDNFVAEMVRLEKMQKLGLIDAETKIKGEKEAQKNFLAKNQADAYKPLEALEAGSVALESHFARQQSQRQTQEERDRQFQEATKKAQEEKKKIDEEILEKIKEVLNLFKDKEKNNQFVPL